MLARSTRFYSFCMQQRVKWVNSKIEMTGTLFGCSPTWHGKNVKTVISTFTFRGDCLMVGFTKNTSAKASGPKSSPCDWSREIDKGKKTHSGRSCRTNWIPWQRSTPVQRGFCLNITFTLPVITIPKAEDGESEGTS